MKLAPRSLTHQTLHTYATLLFSFGAQFLAGVAVARAFGPAGKGQVTYAALLIPFAIAIADGVRTAIMRQAGVEKQPSHVVYGTAVVILAVECTIGSIAFFALYRNWPQTSAYLFVALAFPFAAYAQMAGAFYALTDTLARINFTNAVTIGGGGSLVTLLAFLFLHPSVETVLAIWLFANVAAALFAWQGLRQLVPEGFTFGGPQVGRAMFSFGLKGTLASIADFLSIRITLMIVSAAFLPADLGIYSLAIATAELSWQSSKAVTWASAGRIASGSHTDATLLSARLIRLVLLAQTLIGTALFLAGPWLISHIYGVRFAAAGPVMRILIPGVVLYSVDGILSTFLAIRANRPGLLLSFELVMLAITAGATYAGISRFGIAGAALAASVTYTLTFLVKTAIFARYTRLGFGAILVPRISDLPANLRLRFASGPR